MNKQQIKQATIEQLKQVSAGYKYGEIKTIIIQRDTCEEGHVAIFFKTCKTFETYKGQDTRPCEIYSFHIEEEEEEEDMGDGYEPITTITEHLTLDLYSDVNGKDEEWKEKKNDKLTDHEFLETII
jgi:hypothetical protein